MKPAANMRTSGSPRKPSRIQNGLILGRHCLVWTLLGISQSGAHADNDAQTPTPAAGSGDLILSAPGIYEASYTAREATFSRTVNLGRYYRFTFDGVEAVCDADGVPGTYSYDGYMWNIPKKNNNGNGNNIDGVDSSNPGQGGGPGPDSDPTVDDEKNGTVSGESSGSSGNGTTAAKVPGWWEFLGGVNQVMANSLTFTNDKLNESSPVLRYQFPSPVVFREQQMITLKWSGDGNTKDPDGYFYILGSAVKEPPVPVGQIRLNQTLYQPGSQPTFNWSVVRN